MTPVSKLASTWRSTRPLTAAMSLALSVSGYAMGPAHAQDAAKILHSMSDYIAAQKTISVKYDSDIEVMTSDMQKVQFASSGQLLLSRPDKIRAARSGGYSDCRATRQTDPLTT
jgi:hypothetical protein